MRGLMSEKTSTPSQNESSSPTSDAKQSIEVIVSSCWSVTIATAERTFTLLSAISEFIILIVLRSEELGRVEDRIYSAGIVCRRRKGIKGWRYLLSCWKTPVNA